MDKFEESLKEAMKTELRGAVSSSVSKYSAELAQLAAKSIKEITDWAWDREKFRDIEQAARQGTTSMAARSLIEKVSSDAARRATPKVEEFLSGLKEIMIKATAQAIRELMLEELSKTPEKGQ